jgi:hypothetical protein
VLLEELHHELLDDELELLDELHQELLDDGLELLDELGFQDDELGCHADELDEEKKADELLISSLGPR